MKKEENIILTYRVRVSFGLTDKKPMRMLKTHIVEINEEILQMYKNNPRLEIEYRKIQGYA